jgi:hypothetical protein
MGFWAIWQYDEYVGKHTSPGEKMKLFRDSQELWDDSYPNIYMAFEALPKWLSVENIISLNDKDINFHALLGLYRLEARRHFESVKGWLEQIRRWRTGLALFAEINKGSPRSVFILPYRGKTPNASAGYRSDYSEIGGLARGVPLQQMWNPFEEEPDPTVGKGTGSNSRVRFTPGMYTGSELRKPGNGPDEVLFHELVHSSRAFRGVEDPKYVDHDYDNQEELLAITITNIYLSEKGQQVLVGDHGTKPLQGVERDNWLNNRQHIDSLSPKELMKNFKMSQKEFYKALADLPIPPRWNPVRDHYEFSRRHDTTPAF